MVAPQACVAVEITGSPAAEQRSALERRCSEILGARRCRLVEVPRGADGQSGSACWQVVVATDGGGDTPAEASVVLSDPSDPQHAPVRRDVTFRPNDAVAERWATLGLVIAALVTVEEHSAAEAAPAAPWDASGGGFAPAPEGLRATPAPAPGAPFEVEARAAAVGALGLLPEAALGVRVELSVGRGHVALLGRATVFPESSRAALGATGAGGELQLAAAGLGLCGMGARGRWGGRACLGGDVARTTARGSGVSETNSATSWWGATWLGVAGEVRLLRHLALTAEVEGAVTFLRPTYAIYGVSSTFTAAPLAGAVALGVAVPF
jgi:hypothetical protein